MMKVCLKNVLFSALMMYLAIQPAFAQEKHFQITNDGLYYFFNDATIEQNKVVKGVNTFTRPITARTFFLEAKKAKLFPEEFSFNDFQKMNITEQQMLLDSLQGDFDWSKYHASKTKSDIVQPDFSADTFYAVMNLAFSKDDLTVSGDLVSGLGRMQKFMIYPILSKGGTSVRWMFEWIETDLYLRKRGYKNLDLPEQKIYETLLRQGITLEHLNTLLK